VIAVTAERDSEFGDFVAARYPSLVRTAYLLTGDRGHAEDLVQAALLRTFHAWRRVDAPDHAEAYVRTAMIRLATRARRRRWVGEVPSADLPDHGRADASNEVAEAAVVRAALTTLPWPQRAVLVLRYFDDLTEAQVAEVLGCSVGTVKSRASRALAALRTAGLLDPQSRDVGEVHGGR
jgi:RNA polymerase sigma-70 factor (sigma-E family)